MGKQALISKHLVLTTSPCLRCPAYGIILIQDDLIHDVILLDCATPISEILTQYSEWNPEDLSDSYISPGIIDLNTRLEWESYTELTKAGISGGVTFALTEGGYYKDALPTGELFCDIGKVATLEISTMEMIPYLVEQGYFAAKGYLFSPHGAVQCIPTNLLPVLREFANTPLTLIVDPTLPDPRLLHSVSPFRFKDLADRLRTDIAETASFSAAFPDLIEDEEEDEDIGETSRSRKKPRKLSMLDQGKKSSPTILVKKDRSNSEDAYNSNQLQKDYTQKLEYRKQSGLLLDIEEIKEEDEDIKSMHFYKAKTFTALEDLDKRIKDSQMAIQDISLAEYETYKKSGVTHYLSPVNLAPSSIIFPTSPTSEPSSACSSVPSSPKPSLLQRRKIAGSLSLVITPDLTQKENMYCYHMASYSHMWEISGINKVLQALEKCNCRVHISNISAATAFNRVRQAKELNPRLTCEIPASHLMFSSMSIPEYDTRFKSSPPIRNQSNANLIWELLKYKGIDAISSNHCCVHPDYKKTNGNFRRAANGMPTIGFSLQAVWTTINAPVSKHSQKERYIVKLAKWLSKGPAEVLRIEKKRGSIEKGKFADLIVWNPYEKFVVTQEYSNFPEMSPFIGMELHGKINKVFLRGQLAFNEGKFKARGRIILRGKL